MGLGNVPSFDVMPVPLFTPGSEYCQKVRIYHVLMRGFFICPGRCKNVAKSDIVTTAWADEMVWIKPSTRGSYYLVTLSSSKQTPRSSDLAVASSANRVFVSVKSLPSRFPYRAISDTISRASVSASLRETLNVGKIIRCWPLRINGYCC